ncbi:MAG TPA: DotA/TraY family protein [Candidatus Competibacteraceae bacterium]|nr:DotA/TraY family protein [Candidatus Competibacteraceae bacterium]
MLRSTLLPTRLHRLSWLLGLAVLFTPLIVLAQEAMVSTDILQPDSEDVSVRLLRGILGAVVDKVRFATVIGVEDEGAFGGLFRLFNSFLLLVLGLLLFVKAIVALLDTAHEGEALGQERSTTWTPLRLVMAVGLLLPMVNGYSLAQIGVLWVSLSGAGLADAVWSQAVDRFTQTTLYTQPPPPQARQLAVAMLASNVCEKIVNDLPARGTSEYVVTFNSDSSALGVNTERSARWSVTDLGEAACGGYVIREPAEGIDPRQGATGFDALDGFLHWVADLLGFGADVRRDFSQALMNAHDISALALRQELEPLAEKIVAGAAELGECAGAATGTLTSGRCLSVIDAAAEHYTIRLQGLIVGAVDLSGQRAFTEFTARAQAEGWFTAGSWFYRLAALTDYMNKLALNVPEPYPIRIWEKLPREDIETYAPLLKRLETVVLEAESDGGLGLTTGDPNNSMIDDVSRGFLRATLDWITQSLIGKTHPIFAIAWIGHALIATVIGALGVLGMAKLIATTSGAGRLAQALGGLTDLLTAQSPSGAFTLTGLVIGIVVLALLGFALTAAIYLPMAPFIIWTLAGLHWLLRVFEALLAAPIWAIWFLKNGKGLTAETMTGWLMLFSLLLQPVLMLFGLLAAVTVSYYMLSLVTGAFTVAAINAASGNTTGPVILIGLLILFVLLAVDLTLRSFSLIHRLPDAALRWVGGQIESALDHHELYHGTRHALAEAKQTGLNAAGHLAGSPPKTGMGLAKVKPMGGGKTPD